jgi:hypothetical protein
MGKRKITCAKGFGLPHRNYNHGRKDLEPIFKCNFRDIEPGATDLGKIGSETRISPTTLYLWYPTWKDRPQWRPWRVEETDRHLRIFTTEEEIAIREFITANYVTPGALFTNEDFPRIGMQAFLAKHQDSEDLPEFNCPNGFIKDFKSKNGVSSRRAHYKRRPEKDSMIEDAWMEEMRELMDSRPNPDRIVNCNEICWQVYPDCLRTWVPPESDHVTISIAGSERQSFTAFCSIMALRRKLPMVLIVKEKTVRVEHIQLRNIKPHITAHSQLG